jgi:hypothetical protein
MAQRHKVSIRTQPDTYRMTSNERREARTAEIAGKQGQLKKEAAARRAKRAKQLGGPSPSGSTPDVPA